MNLFLYKGLFVLAQYGCQNYFDCKDTLILCFSVSDMLQEFSYLITTPPFIRFYFIKTFFPFTMLIPSTGAEWAIPSREM